MSEIEILTLPALRRQEKGSAAARKLRRSGRVPGVLYGHGQDVVMLAMPAEAVHRVLESGRHVVTLDLAGTPERALIKDVQFDPWGNDVLHVDFSRVAMDETVTIAVEIVPHGQPKVVLSGGVFEQPLHSLEVECKADHIPDEIRVEVGHLQIGEMIHVRDLELPEGVTASAEEDTIVFIVHEARGEAPAAEVPPETEAASAEPEVIGRPGKPEGEKAAEGESSA